MVPSTTVISTLSRLTSVAAPNNSVNYTYDAASRITNITTPQGSVGYGYDVADRTNEHELAR